MNTVRLSLILLALAVLALSGCQREEQVWIEPTETNQTPNDAPQGHRIILFAPVALGEVAEVNPDASTEFPHDLIKWLTSNADLVTARVGETLPAADSPRWMQGSVPAAAGAHHVVLLTVDDLTEQDAVASPRGVDKEIVATVTLRAVNVLGELQFEKTHTGTAPVWTSPKLLGGDNAPQSRAAYEASRKAVVTFAEWVDSQQNVGVTRNVKTDKPDETPYPLINVAIGSVPENADIIVNGTFRGTTPMTIALPATEIELTIERQGYRPWHRTFKPSSGMEIEPALIAQDTVPIEEEPSEAPTAGE